MDGEKYPFHFETDGEDVEFELTEWACEWMSPVTADQLDDWLDDGDEWRCMVLPPDHPELN